MNRHRVRGLALAGALSLGALTTAACDRPEPGTGETRAPGESGASSEPTTLTILYSGWDEWILTPLPNMPTMHLLYLTLFDYDQNGDPVGKLARSWEHSDDFRTWTYYLRTDARWHDGVQVTAHDIAFTYELYAHPSVTRVDPAAQTVTALDDSTLSITWHRRGRPVDSWMVYLPRHLLKDLDPETLWEWDYWKAPIGNGSYRWVRSAPDTFVELEANDDYFRGRPAIDRVIVKFGADQWIELESGNVDVVENTGVPVQRLLQDPRFEVYWRPGQPGPLWWNHALPMFRDVRVRRAFSLAIDRAALARILGHPEEMPLYDVAVTTRQMLSGDYPQPLPHDPERARALLEEAGWIDADDDGARERDGVPLRFTLTVGGASSRDAVFVQDQLHRVGAQVEIETIDRTVLIGRLRAGEFEAAIGGGGGGRFFDVLLGEPGRPGASYRNPALSDLLAREQASFDPDARERLHRDMWPIFQRDIPVTYLNPGLTGGVAHRRVKGLRGPDRIRASRHMEHLWIEEDGP